MPYINGILDGHDPQPIPVNWARGDPRLAKAITQPMHPAFGGLVPSVSMAYAYDARLTTGKWVPNELGGPAFGSDLNGGKPLPVRLRVALRLAMLPAGEGEGGDREDAAERAAAADPSPEVIDADELEEVSVRRSRRERFPSKS